MRTLVLASHNPGKLLELKRLLAEVAPNISVISAASLPSAGEVEESGATFEENALLKAETIAMKTGLPAIADDSGLCIDALNGSPGVLSARWSGEHGNDQANLAKVLREMENVQSENRSGKFVSVIALALPDGRTEICRGELLGTIRYSPIGNGGFGYDPIFQPNGFAESLAQLSATQKDKISHRGQALRAIAPLIAELLSE